MVDDHVRYRRHASVAQGRDRASKLSLGSVLAIETVQLPREIAFIRSCIRRRRKPHVGESSVADDVRLSFDLLVPAPPCSALMRLPVKALKQEVVGCPRGRCRRGRGSDEGAGKGE